MDIDTTSFNIFGVKETPVQPSSSSIPQDQSSPAFEETFVEHDISDPSMGNVSKKQKLIHEATPENSEVEEITSNPVLTSNAYVLAPKNKGEPIPRSFSFLHYKPEEAEQVKEVAGSLMKQSRFQVDRAIARREDFHQAYLESALLHKQQEAWLYNLYAKALEMNNKLAAKEDELEKLSVIQAEFDKLSAAHAADLELLKEAKVEIENLKKEIAANNLEIAEQESKYGKLKSDFDCVEKKARDLHATLTQFMVCMNIIREEASDELLAKCNLQRKLPEKTSAPGDA